MATAPSARSVLDFWFEDGLDKGWPSRDLSALWFGGGAELDATIRTRFGDLVARAVDGGMVDWEATARQRLALVILLDQFTRNIYRGQSLAFHGDARAQRLARDAHAQAMDAQLPLVGQVFLAMPLMHAEDLAVQDDCVAWFERLLEAAPAERATNLRGHLEAAREHRAIIAAWGRFPHRNAALGRADTELERDYLAKGKRFGQ